MAKTNLRDPVLQQAEEKIEAQLDPALQESYMKIVVAGMHVAVDKGENGILAAIRLSKDPLMDAAKGAIGLVLLMRKQAKGIMPIKAMIPAAMTLMLKALDFANASGVIKVGAPELDTATRNFANQMIKAIGLTPAQIKTALGKVHAISNDPAAVEKMKLASGMTRHPNAPTPTPGV